MRYLFAFILLVSYYPVNAGALDGMVFVGPTGLQGHKVEEYDEVHFNNGELFSSGCAIWGFKSGSYTTETTADGLTFTATTLSPGNGKIVWEGVIQGDEINATYVWTKERWWWRDARQVKWFKGKLKRE